VNVLLNSNGLAVVGTDTLERIQHFDPGEPGADSEGFLLELPKLLVVEVDTLEQEPARRAVEAALRLNAGE
jgi:flagellar basal body rod protein FlgC